MLFTFNVNGLLLHCQITATRTHWIAAGNPADSRWNGISNVECVAESSTQASQGTEYGTDIAVSCCTNDGSGVRQFGANNECFQAKNFGEADAICTQFGHRLCTLAEMLGRKTKGAGCSHDLRYNWVVDECSGTFYAHTNCTVFVRKCPVPMTSAGSGHQVAKGARADPYCGWGNAADSYCQSDDFNQAAYWDNSGYNWGLDIAISCCYEDDDGTVKGWRKCNVEPATYEEAVSLCAGKNMRLCTVDELLYGGQGELGATRGTGCNYNCAYSWASDSCVDINAAASSDVYRPKEVSTGTQPAESGSASTSAVFTAVIAAIAAVVVLVLFLGMRRWKMRTESRKERKSESLSEMGVTVTAHVVQDTAVDEHSVDVVDAEVVTRAGDEI